MSLYSAGFGILRQLNHHTEIVLTCKILTPFLTAKRLYCDNNSTATALRSRKPKSTRNTVQHFVDLYHVRTQGGKGGNGKVSFLQAWANEFAGPDGGDGGNGGHVIFYSTDSVKGFNNVTPVLTAPNGEDGMKKDCTGRNAKNLIINVPIGTIIKDTEGKVIGDLSLEQMMFVAARGGAGGKGNRYFTTNTEQAPRVAELGADGEQIAYLLELRSMAHLGLIGFPNAGKSTLLRAVTRARPRVAPYPFTTLKPHLGTVLYSDHEQLTIADLPGLIEGSHKNKGLGIQFLQHAERCAGLLYMVDASLPKPWKQVEKLQYEISKFSGEMLDRPHLIIANKVDLEESESNIETLREHFKDSEVISISAKHGTNLNSLLTAIKRIYDQSDVIKNADPWQ